tara:strand:- start:1164 stop:2012 length:849 start_codon:yes stop_codon:yes gene_type:complete
MKTINSLSGGKTSSYIAANYPADYDVFSLVRIEDNNAKFKDEKIRKEVEDRIQAPFISTAEDDTIIYTMLDLEQFIGRKITWVTGKTFDEITTRKDKVYLPNKVQRFCTVEMKIEPMFYWWAEHIGEPTITRIGFRANETRRAKNMLDRCNENGFSEFKATFEKHKDGRNKWELVEYQKPHFPLIEDNIYKDTIVNYWKDKPVRFAWMNNCVGCFHKTPLLLRKMFEKHPKKLEWFAKRERESTNNAHWRSDLTYDEIKKWNLQNELFDDDFNECDSGYCGI